MSIKYENHKGVPLDIEKAEAIATKEAKQKRAKKHPRVTIFRGWSVQGIPPDAYSKTQRNHEKMVQVAKTHGGGASATSSARR